MGMFPAYRRWSVHPHSAAYGEAMTKPLTVEKRLSAIEDQVAKLGGDALIGGIIAKAQNSAPYDPLADDGESLSPDARRMNIFENRMNKLEKRFDALYSELIGEKPAQDSHQDDDRAALDVLAKAQSAVARKSTPAGLLARAQAVLDDPTAVGMVETYVQGGQLIKAAELLERHERRADQGDEDVALEKMEGQLANHELMVTVSELGEKMGNFETTMNSLLARLSRLERPQAAPVQEAVVAKGYRGKGRQNKGEDYRDSPAGLAERCQGVIENASLVGQLNSMLQSDDSAQITQARQTIESAELRHESRMKTRERRAL